MSNYSDERNKELEGLLSDDELESDGGENYSDFDNG